jgi:hypothetical protein
MTARREKERERELRGGKIVYGRERERKSQYIPQGHTSNDLTSFH